ncbi:unnamed protein product [Pleuronectes platessa]|uniref:TFIIE beta domain-containing protein n=1 Tax=Pleuronectes platessa TaxID=8262 RepID=A0A9N7Z854_PLEPL|nr:unnamed protein product [Pleuronectes platessa]
MDHVHWSWAVCKSSLEGTASMGKPSALKGFCRHSHALPAVACAFPPFAPFRHSLQRFTSQLSSTGSSSPSLALSVFALPLHRWLTSPSQSPRRAHGAARQRQKLPPTPQGIRMGDTHCLTLEEILDETKLLDISMKQKHWLMTEALVNNPKIDVRDGTFGFKPKYNLKDKKALLRLLDKHDQLGLGGVLLDDVEEGLPNSAKAIKVLGDQIIFVTRPDKKKILFYNDKHCQFTVDEEFQKLWRSVPVDNIDEEKIEEYLKKQGISSMQETGPKKVMPVKRKKQGGQRKRHFKTHNNHLAGVLEDYSEGVPAKK